MKHADLSPVRRTSVTIRSLIRRKLKDASRQMADRGLRFSEQRLLHECLRLSLRFWRGRKGAAARNKKYNRRKGPFEIMPFYTSEALRSAAWGRCHHSGISFSRLADFAVSTYLARVVEYWLRFEYRGRDKADVQLWSDRYARRRNPQDFVISYECETQKNDGVTLRYAEKTKILPWPPPLKAAA